MNVQAAIRLALTRYADFQGRSGKVEYTVFVIFVFLLSLVLSVIFRDWLVSLVMLLVLIPNIAVGVRRLHDIDASGWWYLLVLVPVVGLIMIIALMFMEGTPGPNRFGPPAPPV